MQPVGTAAWPCNPALPSTYPMRNHDGRDGLAPAGAMPLEALLTPSADRPAPADEPEPIEEVPGDDVPREADDTGSE